MDNFLNIFAFTMLPLVAGLIIFFNFFKNNTIIIRRFSKYFSIFYFIYSILFVTNYNINSELQYISQIKNFTLGSDLLSVILCCLVSFVVLICFIVAKSTLGRNQNRFYSFALFFESSVMLVLCAQDFLTFFAALFFEIFCAYMLISNFTTLKAKESAKKYLCANSFFAFMLLGAFAFINTIFFKNSIPQEFINLPEASPYISSNIQFLAFLGLLLVAAIKIPVFPLHRPLLNTIQNSVAHTSCVFLSEFIIGFYILIKLNMYGLSEIFSLFAPWLGIIGIFNIIYFGILAIGQEELKKSFAYFCFSQSSIALVALASTSIDGICGAIYQIISQTLILLGLFLAFCFAIQYLKTSKLPFMGALATKTPKLAALTFMLTLAGAGLPLTSGFVGKFLCIMGGFSTQIYSQDTLWFCTIFTLFGFILGLIYLIKTFQNIFFGADECSGLKIHDLLRHRWTALLTITIFIVILGISPHYLGAMLSTYADMIISMFSI